MHQLKAVRQTAVCAQCFQRTLTRDIDRIRQSQCRQRITIVMLTVQYHLIAADNFLAAEAE